MRRGVRPYRLKIVTKPNGKRYIYRRDNMVRLPDLPEDHPDFLRAYVEAEALRKPKLSRFKAGTVADAAQRYMNSGTWRGLAQSTQDFRRRILCKIIDERGSAPMAQLEDRHIRKDIERLDPGPAVNRLKVWRALCGFAGSDAAAKVTPPNVKSTPYKRWMPEHKAQFREYWPHGTQQRTAMEVFNWTGARCSDVRRLGRQMIDPDGMLCFAQQKTGGQVMIPWVTLPDWASPMADDFDHLQASLRGHNDMLFVTTGRGAARSLKGLSQWFAEQARCAGIEDRTAHGFRKSRSSELAEYGISSLRIQTWTGHQSLREVEEYQREAARRSAMLGTEQVQNAGNRSGNVWKLED